MVVTLPFVLLLLDYWPLARMNPEQRGPSGMGKDAVFCFWPLLPA